MGWIHLAENRDRLQSLGNTIMNFCVYNVGTVLHGVSGEISYSVSQLVS